MKDLQILNALHFRGIPNGKSFRSLLFQEYDLKKQKLKSNFDIKVMLITNQHHAEVKELKFYYETLREKLDAEINIKTAAISDEYLADVFQQISSELKSLIEEKSKISKEYLQKRHEADIRFSKELSALRISLSEENNKLEEELQERMRDLHRNSVKEAIDLRQKILDSIKPDVPPRKTETPETEEVENDDEELLFKI